MSGFLSCLERDLTGSASPNHNPSPHSKDILLACEEPVHEADAPRHKSQAASIESGNAQSYRYAARRYSSGRESGAMADSTIRLPAR